MPVIADRLVFSGTGRESPRSILIGFAVIGSLSASLLLVLQVTTDMKHVYPNLWMVLCAGLSIGLARVRFAEEQRLIGRLLTLIGFGCGLYALVHYPLMPVQPGAEMLFYLHGLVWVAALACTLLCWRWPGLALWPASYIIWSALTAEAITGLYHSTTLDIAPLAEVALCLAMGVALLLLYRWLTQRVRIDTGIAVERHFSQVVLMLAVCIHLANYYMSFVAKMDLPGPPFAWVRENNPLYIYLAALDVGHIMFADTWFASAVAWFLDKTHFLSNIFVLLAQALALAGFLIPKRGLVLLLIFFDVMHLGIVIAVGANFWPWIALNLAIIVVVQDPGWRQPRLLIGIIAAMFVWKSQRFVDVAWLGWFDSGATNSLVMWAEDDAGKRHLVSTNFFGFYSYPIGHFYYGTPGAKRAFDTHQPNGGTDDYAILKAGRSCNTKILQRPNRRSEPPPAFDRFIREYNAMAISLEAPMGWYPWHAYAHHFYELPSRMASFANLDKKRVTAYIYRRESVCLSWVDGKVQRKLISQAEHRIPIDATSVR